MSPLPFHDYRVVSHTLQEMRKKSSKEALNPIRQDWLDLMAYAYLSLYKESALHPKQMLEEIPPTHAGFEAVHTAGVVVFAEAFHKCLFRGMVHICCDGAVGEDEDVLYLPTAAGKPDPSSQQ